MVDVQITNTLFEKGVKKKGFNPKPETLKIQYKNSEIQYTKTGSGPSLIWLHGFMESKEIWEKITDYFDSNFTSVCIDLLGHGETDCVEKAHTMEEQANMVATVLEVLEIKKCSLIGHSMGGYIALALLEKQQNQILHFVLLNSTSNSDSEEKKLNRDRAIKIVATQKNNFARMGIINLFSEDTRNLFLKEIEQLIILAQKMSVKGIIASLKGMKIRINRTLVLKEFKGKKMIVSGKNDPILPYQDAVIEAQKTQSLLLTLRGGHMSYLEASEKLTVHLYNFLSS